MNKSILCFIFSISFIGTAFADSMIWDKHTIDTSACHTASLKLDKKNSPCIAYHHGPKYNLTENQHPDKSNIDSNDQRGVCYAYIKDGTWVKESITGADDGDSDYGISLAFDSNQCPYISYVDTSQQQSMPYCLLGRRTMLCDIYYCQ